MQISALARLAGFVTLTAGLAGCIDVEMDITVLSDATARGTMTASIDKQMYDMLAAQEGGAADFCEDGELTIEETIVKCSEVKEGAFADLIFDEDPEGAEPAIVNEGGGRVRVTFPTNTLGESMGEEATDPQALAMMTAMFEGHSLVLKVSGGRIVDTNMEIAPDGNSASLTISFVDLISGKATVPDEAYAVVQK